MGDHVEMARFLQILKEEGYSVTAAWRLWETRDGMSEENRKRGEEILSSEAALRAHARSTLHLFPSMRAENDGSVL